MSKASNMSSWDTENEWVFSFETRVRPALGEENEKQWVVLKKLRDLNKVTKDSKRYYW